VRELTSRQRAILDWITHFLDTHGIPPTVREIGHHFRISSAGVFGHLKALEKKGVLRRRRMGARSIEVLGHARPDGSALARVPVLGRIVAGEPLLAEENRESTIRVDLEALGAAAGVFFALEVHGESMIEAGIFPGDTVICRRQETARDGQIVVALVEGETTLKRFFREGGRVRLDPANATMKPIYPADVAVQGVVAALVRRYT
jgi:repressor LexA